MKWIGANWLVGQNKFRQLMLNHFSPRDKIGNLPKSVAAGSYAFNNQETHTSTNLKDAIQAIRNAGLALNTFWKDAGWYTVITPQTDPSLYEYLTITRKDSLWLSGAGDWIPDRQRFPAGYAEVSEAARTAGMKSLLWFEPERVSEFAQNYSLFASQHRLLQSHSKDPNEVKIFGSYNLSDGNNVNLMAGLISSRIQSMHLDIFRQDMNGPGPLEDWLPNDQNQSNNMAGIARIGMTEPGFI
jgi:hypothetical protein